jgi:predicted nucleotidyltransferase component of viral defense system
MSKQIEQRVKDKLKTISKESQVPFNHLLDTLFLERFLARIAESRHSENLIFKGGMCLAQIIELKRETRDIDFLLTDVKANQSTVKTLVEEIAQVDLSDGFVFSEVEVDILSLEHKKYPGYRINIKGQLSQIKNTVSIDIGVGDVVRPNLLEVELLESNGPLFEESVKLNSYPPEYIFSEKFEAILHLGDVNSRMKDFYDCYTMIQEGVLDAGALKDAINETLKNRETPFTLISDPSEGLTLKWNSFKKKFKRLEQDLEFGSVVMGINKYIKMVFGIE